MRLSDSEVKMFRGALEYLYDEIPKETNTGLTPLDVEMRPAFVSHMTTMTTLQRSLRQIQIRFAGTKYQIARRRIQAQPFCTIRQLDLIILHWVHDRRLTITFEELSDQTKAGHWIYENEEAKKRRLREAREQDRAVERAVRFRQPAQEDAAEEQEQEHED